MRQRRLASALATLALTAWGAAPARADLSCGAFLMPAGQLKQVSRGVSAHHAGLDLVAPHGSPLRAAAPGVVVAAHIYFGYGNLVDIDHGNGVVTRYAHMADFAPGIHAGTPVTAGQLLGRVGRTGHATTAHVHFEVRINGRPVDPKPYLSLATCTPRTPQRRFDLAAARAGTAGNQLLAHAQAQSSAQFPGQSPVRGASGVFIEPALALSAPPPRRIEGRPGGLLD